MILNEYEDVTQNPRIKATKLQLPKAGRTANPRNELCDLL